MRPVSLPRWLPHGRVRAASGGVVTAGREVRADVRVIAVARVSGQTGCTDAGARDIHRYDALPANPALLRATAAAFARPLSRRSGSVQAILTLLGSRGTATQERGLQRQVKTKRLVERGHDRRGGAPEQLADPLHGDRADLLGLCL